MIQIVKPPSPPGAVSAPIALQLATQLFDRLGVERVRYCHWKSNQALAAALSGVGDLDLLVAAEDTDRFHAILSELGFKLVAQPPWQSQRSVVHYYGCDGPTGRLLHLHVYYRLVTGGHVLKNYRLPLEKLMLTRNHRQFGVIIPDRAVELLVFVIRKMLEAGGWCELALQYRDRPHMQRELNWLLPARHRERDALLRDVCGLLREHLPQLDESTWRDGLEWLMTPRRVLSGMAIGRRFRRQLRGLALHGPMASRRVTWTRVARLLWQRVLHRRSRKWLAHGGHVIALIGPEASGKTTLAASLCHSLAPALVVRGVHLGRPSATWLGRCANGVRRLCRWASGHQRGGAAEPPRQTDRTQNRRTTWWYALASVLLARERYHAACRAHRDASRAELIICDRYPALEYGSIDGPRLAPSREAESSHWWHRLAARWERRYYRSIARPDVVVRLVVPVSVALQRNRNRIKPDKESDAALTSRHRQFADGDLLRTQSMLLDTTRPMPEVLAELRQIVWRQLV